MQLDPNFILRLVRAKMPFGKYKDRYIVDIPVHYLEFLARDGFKDDTLGQYLSTMHEIKINGIEKVLEPFIRERRYQDSINAR